LFTFREKAKVDGAGLKNEAAGAIFEYNQVVADVLDVKVILGAGLDGGRVSHRAWILRGGIISPLASSLIIAKR